MSPVYLGNKSEGYTLNFFISVVKYISGLLFLPSCLLSLGTNFQMLPPFFWCCPYMMLLVQLQAYIWETLDLYEDSFLLENERKMCDLFFFPFSPLFLLVEKRQCQMGIHLFWRGQHPVFSPWATQLLHLQQHYIH